MTETITRRTNTRDKAFCEEGYDYYENIGQFYDAVTYEEEIE